jgi:hypothetical protein
MYISVHVNFQLLLCDCNGNGIFSADLKKIHRISQPIRCTGFRLKFFKKKKKKDECNLIFVIHWNKTGLLRSKILLLIMALEILVRSLTV